MHSWGFGAYAGFDGFPQCLLFDYGMVGTPRLPSLAVGFDIVNAVQPQLAVAKHQ